MATDGIPDAESPRAVEQMPYHDTVVNDSAATPVYVQQHPRHGGARTLLRSTRGSMIR